jgi:hypothetical protein
LLPLPPGGGGGAKRPGPPGGGGNRDILNYTERRFNFE